MNKLQSNETNRHVRSGVDDFLGIIKSYGKIIVWTLGAAAAPIAAGMAELAPPWPPAIIQVTALFEMLVLVLTFQFLMKTNFAKINNLLLFSMATIVLFTLFYLAAFSEFVYEEPLSRLKFVKGFACTSEAVIVFPGGCPFYTDDNLRWAEWEASRLWKPWSITFVRLCLVILWTSVFVSIATLLGSFLVYQSGIRSRTPRK